jgi:hypothetical protein
MVVVDLGWNTGSTLSGGSCRNASGSVAMWSARPTSDFTLTTVADGPSQFFRVGTSVGHEQPDRSSRWSGAMGDCNVRERFMERMFELRASAATVMAMPSFCGTFMGFRGFWRQSDEQ